MKIWNGACSYCGRYRADRWNQYTPLQLRWSGGIIIHPCFKLNSLLTEPMLTNHQWGLVAVTSEQFYWKCSRYLFLIMSFKNTNWRLQLDLTGINELISFVPNHIVDLVSSKAINNKMFQYISWYKTVHIQCSLHKSNLQYIQIVISISNYPNKNNNNNNYYHILLLSSSLHVLLLLCTFKSLL